MRFLKFVGKMVLKLVALPVLFVLGLICLLAKLVVNVSSFAIGALILYILGCCIEILERRIQEEDSAEVNEMVRTANVTPEQLALLLRQAATATPNPAALSAVGATFNKEDDSNEDDE